MKPERAKSPLMIRDCPGRTRGSSHPARNPVKNCPPPAWMLIRLPRFTSLRNGGRASTASNRQHSPSLPEMERQVQNRPRKIMAADHLTRGPGPLSTPHPGPSPAQARRFFPAAPSGPDASGPGASGLCAWRAAGTGDPSCQMVIFRAVAAPERRGPALSWRPRA